LPCAASTGSQAASLNIPETVAHTNRVPTSHQPTYTLIATDRTGAVAGVHMTAEVEPHQSTDIVISTDRAGVVARGDTATISAQWANKPVSSLRFQDRLDILS
jgi:hypothetical protein